MKFKASVRFRATLAFALLGAVVSLGIAGTLYLLTQDLEEDLIAETLSAELNDFMLRYAQDPQTPPPTSTTIRTHVFHPDSAHTPQALRELVTGLQHITLDDRNYYAEMRTQNGVRFVLLYDDSLVRQREAQYNIFLGIALLIMMFMSALLGFWLAGRVVSPVAELAARVAELRPEDQPSPLANDFPTDELGELARVFDAYLLRLNAFIEREQAFTADVSHELRTPLTVIEGAADVLLSDPALDEASCARVKRIKRSASEMSELVKALLLLARERSDVLNDDSCAVHELLDRVVENHRHMLNHKPVEVELQIDAQLELPVECTLLRVVLANLIRNAFSYTVQGRVRISLNERGVLVEDTGVGIPVDEIKRVFERYYVGPSGSGEGIGLSLVKRICQRYAWRISIESHKGEGTSIQLLFDTPTAGHAKNPA